MPETKDSLIIILFLGTACLIAFFAGMLLFVLKYQRKVLLHQQELAKKEEEKQKELLRAVIESQENTQNFLAKELHDGILQEMATLRFGISPIATLLKKNELPLSSTDQLKADLDSCIKNIRSLSHSILPSILKEEGLTLALESIIHKVNEAKAITAEFVLNGTVFEQSQEVELAFFRIAQEAIQNTLKYAEAQKITLAITFSPNSCIMIVKDNGKGYDQALLSQNGIGLKNMQSRANVIDAKIDFSSEPSVGTTVIVEKTYI